jgi:hypothetical protein
MSKELLIYRNRGAGYLVEKLSGMGFGEFLRTPAIRAARDARHRLPSAIGQDRAFPSCYQPEIGGAGLNCRMMGAIL